MCEIPEVSSGARRFIRKADRSDLGVGRTDRTPDRLPREEDIGIVSSSCVVEGQNRTATTKRLNCGSDASGQLHLSPAIGKSAQACQ
jgi:hypothetical protein